MLFKDVAKYYIGCKIKTSEGIGTFNVLYTPGTVKPTEAIPIGSYDLIKSELHFHEVKPILKRLKNLKSPIGNNLNYVPSYLFHQLISNGYDLFDLIDNNEAIDENDVK